MNQNERVDGEYKKLESEIYNYFLKNNKILGSIIIGSRAFSYSEHSELSDLDILFYTSHPTYFLNNLEWVNEIRKVKSSHIITIDGLPILKIEFIDGLKTDFGIYLYDRKGLMEQLNKHSFFINFNTYFGSNKRLFLDKEGIITKIFKLLKS